MSVGYSFVLERLFHLQMRRNISRVPVIADIPSSPTYSLVAGDAAQLDELDCLVGEVAGEQEQVARLHLDGKPHEQSRVDAQSCKGRYIAMATTSQCCHSNNADRWSSLG